MSANTERARPAPAFQEYASDMLANSRYRTMSLSERGLLDTMRRECWVNGMIPKNIDELAAYLGKSSDEIKHNLSIRVLSFFSEKNDQLICPELEAYRTSLQMRTKKLSLAGQKGGKTTQQKNKDFKATLEGKIKPLRGDEPSGDEKSRDEKRFLGRGISIEEMNEFVAEYDRTPDNPNAYFLASRGGC